MQWTVPGFGGRNYHVGVYHGEDSGHLMVHCNNNVILIDFGVKYSNSYSFYLDEELFELHIFKEQNRFSYDLTHNEDIDSPHNRRKEQEKKTSRWRLIAGLGTLLVFVVAFVIAESRGLTDDRLAVLEKLSAGQGVETQVSLYQQGKQWYGSYRVDETVHNTVLNSSHPIYRTGLDLQTGDLFPARYLPEYPNILWVEWTQPSATTLARLLHQTMEYHASQHPELSPQQVGCQVRLAYELQALDGLGIIFGQNRRDAPKFNRNDYLRLTRSTEFRQGNNNCL